MSGGFFGDLVDDVAGAVGDVLGGVADVVGSVGDVVASTVDKAMSDPIGTIASVAAVATGNAWALPLISGANTIAHGGSLEDALLSAGTSYAAGQVGAELGSNIRADAIMNGELPFSTANSLGNIAGNVASTAVRGGDPLQALISGGVGAGVGELTSQLPGFSDLPPLAQQAVRTAISSELQGRDPTQALINQALNAGLNEVKNFTPGGATTPTSNASDYPVQDFGEGNAKKYLDEYQTNLQEIGNNGGYTSQWADNGDGTHTLRNDDGSTITVDDAGNPIGTTDATDTAYVAPTGSSSNLPTVTSNAPAAAAGNAPAAASNAPTASNDSAATRSALPSTIDPKAPEGLIKTVGKMGFETRTPGLTQLYASLMGANATPFATPATENSIAIPQETVAQLENTNPDMSPYYAHGGLVHHFAEGGSLEAAPGTSDVTKALNSLGSLNSGIAQPKHNLVQVKDAGVQYRQKILPQLASLLQSRGMTLADGGQPSEHPGDYDHPNYDGTPVFRTGGLEGLGGKYVEGKGDGTSDDISAMLANGEYVFSADVVSALGNGSNKAGADRLSDMVKAIRERARSAPADKLPPDAKSPLEYLKSSKGKKHG